jgi:hypothetical protein
VGHIALSLEIHVEFPSKIIKENKNIWVNNIELNLTLRSTSCRLCATSVSILPTGFTPRLLFIVYHYMFRSNRSFVQKHVVIYNKEKKTSEY